MLEAAADLRKPVYQAYLAEDIRRFLEEHPEYERAAILLSGDVGFYSGAKKLLEQFPKDEIRICSGISSVVYLCGQLHTSWDDVKLVSVHGRRQNLVGAVRTNRKVFALVGKQESFREMCRELQEFGLEQVLIHAGCHLSYPEERILSGTPGELLTQEVGDLTAVLIENPDFYAPVTYGLEDACFLRDKAPMTKSEIRSISLSRLELARDSVVYDVGAGTGSVSVEMALLASDGWVYAIEKKPEAVELIRKNQKKFGAANLEVVEGLAPAALEALPAPTHAFIGGSSGNMEEILRLLLKKNPRIRIVVNAIALETVAETISCMKKLPICREDIVTAAIGKSKSVAGYHMMMGQNPVYVISFSGREEDNCTTNH